MGFFGDSLTEGPPYSGDYVTPLAEMLNVKAIKEATAGHKTSDLITAMSGSPALAVDESLCLIGVGDCAQGIDASTIQGNLDTIAAALPVPYHFLTIPPFGQYTTWSEANETIRLTVNTYIRGTFPYIELEDLLLADDGVSLKEEYADPDGLHWSDAGALAVANTVAAGVRA